MRRAHRFRSSGRCWIVAIWILAATSPNADQKPRTDPTIFRAGIDVVSLNVSVKDHGKTSISNLAPDDFLVFEDNVPQTVVSVSRQRVPLGLALLLDTSASM